jgi:hypothetical protein
MTEGWLRETVENFWALVGQIEPPPRSLEASVTWALPISIEKVPNLTVSKIQTWLEHYNIPYPLPYSDRLLYGCLVAYKGHGIVLLDENDSDEQIRFSLAHETAHFLVDYLQVRRQAITKLGSNIIEVLDGLRPQTIDEQVHAILGGLCLGINIDLMERPRDISHCSDNILEVEDKADRLALELLASEDEVYQYIIKIGGSITSKESKSLIINTLSKTFGLPNNIAQIYGSYLYHSWYSEPTIQEWLGCQT